MTKGEMLDGQFCYEGTWPDASGTPRQWWKDTVFTERTFPVPTHLSGNMLLARLLDIRYSTMKYTEGTYG